MKRFLVIGIILLILFCNISFTTLSDENSGNLGGKTLYVGGTGPGNYTKIQDAIDNASDGDTVFVYSGTYYIGGIEIYKSINLVGEDKYNTILKAEGKLEPEGDKANVSATLSVGSDVLITGFSFDYFLFEFINLNSILSNNILNNSCVWLAHSNNYIINNIITNNNISFAIIAVEPKCYISGNFISGNLYGIGLSHGSHIISNNTFSKNNYGLIMYPHYTYAIFSGSSGNITVYGNTFIENNCGLYIYRYLDRMVRWNKINHNNFIKNSVHAMFVDNPVPRLVPFEPISQNTGNTFIDVNLLNRWNNNYWDDWNGFGPKPIKGKIAFLVRPLYLNLETYEYVPILIPFFRGIPFYNFDWHPAKEPYDIPVPEA